MDREGLLKIIKNATTKTEILNILGYHKNGNGFKKVMTLCDKYDIDFSKEFGVNIKKYSLSMFGLSPTNLIKIDCK